MLRSRAHRALEGGSKSRNTMDLLCCTMSDLKQHVERRFAPEMTWCNQGKHTVECDKVPLSLVATCHPMSKLPLNVLFEV